MASFLQSPAQILVLGSLTLLSLADLHFRTLPGIRVFFIAALLFGMRMEPWKVLAIFLVVRWGMDIADVNARPRLMILLIFPALFYPAIWSLVMTAAGTRSKLIARGDLLAIGGIASLLDGYGALFALFGILIWQGFWKRGRSDSAPALPGMLLGVFVEFGIRTIL